MISVEWSCCLEAKWEQPSESKQTNRGEEIMRWKNEHKLFKSNRKIKKKLWFTSFRRGDLRYAIILWDDTVARVLTGFLWRPSEGSLNCAAVRVVSAADATSVLHFVGANLPVAANFLVRIRRRRRGWHLICKCSQHGLFFPQVLLDSMVTLVLF